MKLSKKLNGSKLTDEGTKEIKKRPRRSKKPKDTSEKTKKQTESKNGTTSDEKKLRLQNH